MKKTLLFASAAVFALCFAACQKEENNGLQFTACMEQTVDIQGGKTVVKGELIMWEQGDLVMISDAGGNRRTYTATPREDDSTWAILTPVGEGAALGDGPYTAIFPSFLAMPGNSLLIQNPQSSSDGRLSNMFPMYSVSSSTTMQFKNLCGVLRVHLQQSGVNIKKITVEADEYLSGWFFIGGPDNAPTLTNNITVMNNVSLECTQAQDITEGHDFYIFMPANSYHNMTLTFYQDDNSYCNKACGQTVVIERSKISTATLTNSLEFEGGDAPGRLPGLFSVGDGHQVYFSQGNLQWTSTGTHAVDGNGTAAGTWRFAEHQYDVVGSDNSNISSSNTGWIDLFGWGTSGYHNSSDSYNTNCYPYSISSMYSVSNTDNNYGYGPSTNMTDPNLTGTSANYDWGVYNAISNGGNAPNLWRTLTYDEWCYLIDRRPDANHKRATGQIQLADDTYVHGFIILPDSWTLPSDCSFTAGVSSSETDYSRNTYTLAQWSEMEAAGALFLPAAGYRLGSRVDDVGHSGCYWSSSYYNSDRAYSLYFTCNYVSESALNNRYNGQSVRLAQDND